MPRRTFSSLNPAAYRLAAWCRRMQRSVTDARLRRRGFFATHLTDEALPHLVFRHDSPIRRRLGGVDPALQEGKARSLAVASGLLDCLVIRPGEVFSLWQVIGRPSAERGFHQGLMLQEGEQVATTGGGLCQLSNLLHWMVLHSPLDIVEHHHHSAFDLFPDDDRLVPFGTGTSIVYNYLDYRFRNSTATPFQLRMWVDGDFLRGEIRGACPPDCCYDVHEEDAYFYRQPGPDGTSEVRRHNTVWREVRGSDGTLIERRLVVENDALTCYDESLVSAPILASRL